jgi:hypothetical protein
MLPLYELKIEDDTDFISAISLVETPAIKEDFVLLSDTQVELSQVSEDKRLLAGDILTPNRAIYRRDKNEEYNIFFSEETVEKAAQKYMADKRQDSVTLEHQGFVDGVSLVESWIVENPDMDKSNNYGKPVPKGTWFGVFKVEDEELWKEQAKSGKIKGFSIEGKFTDSLANDKRKSSLSDQQIDNAVLNVRDIIKEFINL